jgi:hypothetical protein
MGIPIGILLALVGLMFGNGKKMFSVTIKAFLINIAVAFLTGLIGLAYGHFFLAKMPKSEFQDWFIPENLIDFKNFISVGSMHNFSYFGGVFGLVGAIIYMIVVKLKINRLKTRD